ncbi:MAG: ImmA/IrrE family metallo-endopeptidase [Hespellia sp.]|nr:ImmA/IrrE family metallo-endopeptidase [Hespellia sp.]
MDADVNTIITDMPPRIKSYVVANKDLSYTIVINARMAYGQQLISYSHELSHIRNGDYEKKCNVDIIEFNAH